MTSLSGIRASPASTALPAAARIDRVAGGGPGRDQDGFRAAQEQAQDRAQGIYGSVAAADDTSRALARLDNNVNTRLNQSEFDTGSASTVQAAGRLPAPGALFVQDSSDDTRASRTDMLGRRAGTTESRVGAASVGSVTVDRQASGIDIHAAENLRLADIAAGEATAEPFASTFSLSRGASAGATSDSAADAASSTTGDPRQTAQMQLQLRQYQQVGASTSPGSASGNAVALVA